MSAKSEPYARSDDNSSMRACVRFVVVGGGAWDRDDDDELASSWKLCDRTEGESGCSWSPEGGSGGSVRSMDSKSPASDIWLRLCLRGISSTWATKFRASRRTCVDDIIALGRGLNGDRSGNGGRFFVVLGIFCPAEGCSNIDVGRW